MEIWWIKGLCVMKFGEGNGWMKMVGRDFEDKLSANGVIVWLICELFTWRLKIKRSSNELEDAIEYSLIILSNPLMISLNRNKIQSNSGYFFEDLVYSDPSPVKQQQRFVLKFILLLMGFVDAFVKMIQEQQLAS
jgi:hypothetical protein